MERFYTTHCTHRENIEMFRRAESCAQARAHVTTPASFGAQAPAGLPAPPLPRALADSVINKPYRCLLVRHAASLTSRPRT